MQFLFIIITVAAIVIYSAKHDLTSLTQFMGYFREDTYWLMLWLGIAIFILSAVWGVMLIGRKK
ncbi:hypothetical protein ALQ79_200385 [Pseudomonas amygdali pv. lachrymans]|nr:hypothetical protein ALQ79_200385 [Pseudomonas amygdali pv. lachrymans]